MVLRAKPLTSRAGEFYARCNLVETHWVERARLPADARAALMLIASPMVYPATDSALAERNAAYEVLASYPYAATHHGYRLNVACAFGETHDRAAFEAHMAEAHGRKMTATPFPEHSTQSLSRRAKGLWRAPRLNAEGKPWAERKGKPLTQTCPTCGLVAEVGERAADVLWWDEHQRGCAIAAGAVAEAGVA